MRHLKAGRALGVKPAHRRAMMRNLVTSLLEHERITTTVARAKEMRIPLEKMITLGKKGDLPARRRALSFVKSKKAMSALFDELPERYAERPGGYCRIVRVGTRRGDGADMALIQLVDAPNDVLAHAEKPTSRRRRGSGKTVQADVAEQVKGKGGTQQTTEEKGKAPKEEKQDQEAPQDEVVKAAVQEEQAEATQKKDKSKPAKEEKAAAKAEAETVKPAEDKGAKSKAKKASKAPAKKAKAAAAAEEKSAEPAKESQDSESGTEKAED